MNVKQATMMFQAFDEAKCKKDWREAKRQEGYDAAEAAGIDVARSLYKKPPAAVTDQDTLDFHAGYQRFINEHAAV